MAVQFYTSLHKWFEDDIDDAAGKLLVAALYLLA